MRLSYAFYFPAKTEALKFWCKVSDPELAVFPFNLRRGDGEKYKTYNFPINLPTVKWCSFDDSEEVIVRHTIDPEQEWYKYQCKPCQGNR